MKRLLIAFCASIATILICAFLYSRFHHGVPDNEKDAALAMDALIHYTHYNETRKNNMPDFADAAATGIGATVKVESRYGHIGSIPESDRRYRPFGIPVVPESGSGSGALISGDGYIVTNNHVVDKATEIWVTLSNKRSLKAKLIGSDPWHDLALIKVEAKGLPFLLWGDAAELKIGQWVLAVGYPFNLESTVTQGIISGRQGMSVTAGVQNHFTKNISTERFIQTDAVINHGNSGGPLINTEGKLIGINAYLVSFNDAYVGYSFAIPVNIVRRSVEEMMKMKS